MLSAEGIGKNLEQAIENALFELKAPREDVDIKVISEGGLFKKARVVVTISDDAKDKYIKKSKDKEVFEKEETKEKFASFTKKSNDENVEKETISTAKEKRVLKEVDIDKKFDKSPIVMQEAQNVDNEVNGENASINELSTMEPMEFLKGFFEVAGKEVEINVKEDGDYITYSVEGDDLGEMIGHRGECYYAINRLLMAVTGKQEKKILLDIGGYRAKREEVLTNLAKRTAERVAKTGRYSRLDPMNASERRIIHNALSDDGRVVTMSKGEEPKRYVMIFPKGEE